MADTIARALKDADVRNAKPQDKPYKKTDGGGLYLLVQPTGAKLWRYKFRVAGKEGLHSLGSYPEVSLADARKLHQAARIQVAGGVNPVQARKIERGKAAQEEKRAQAGAFGTVLQSWRTISDPRLAPVSLRQRGYEIKKWIEPAFKGRLVHEISRGDIVDLLKKVELGTPEVAKNLRNYLNATFEHAIDLGLIEANPVPPPRAMVPRQAVSHKAMSVETLPAFLATLDSCGSNLETRAAMLLTILTACRKSEATGASWSEFDLDAGEWVIPAARMKARHAHWVPLPRQAVELLKTVREFTRSRLAFPNRHNADKPMSERTLNALLENNGFAGETVHGFRSVFSTRFNALGRNPDVIERCLAHVPADAVRRAYNRHEYKAERRELLQEWADWLDSIRPRDEKKAA